jgi:hypothetical protein
LAADFGEIPGSVHRSTEYAAAAGLDHPVPRGTLLTRGIMTGGRELPIEPPGGGAIACHLSVPDSSLGPGLLVPPKIDNRNPHICGLADISAEG